MVAGTARWSHGWFLGWASKPKSWVAIGGGYIEFAGFPVVHQKPLGSLVDPQSHGRRTEDGAAAALDWSDRWVPVWPVCDDAVRRLRRGGHVSESHGLRRDYAGCGRKKFEDFQNRP
jgi:hypothetical protein